MARGEQSVGSPAGSLLPIVAQVEQEIEALLAASRREAEELAERARLEAADLSRTARAGLEAKAKEAFDAELAAGAAALAREAEVSQARLLALRARVEARLGDAAAAIATYIAGEDVT